jgi:hypothetical protein
VRERQKADAGGRKEEGGRRGPARFKWPYLGVKSGYADICDTAFKDPTPRS